MADVRPFAGFRPRADLAAKITSPPYDVLSTEEARAMAAGNPLSFLRVTKSEIELGPEVDPHSDLVYERAALNLRALSDQGALVRDPVPCFYLYELRRGDHVQRGVVLGASVAEYEAGSVRRHELTRRDKEEDRARHVERLMANTGPVLLTYRADRAIANFVAERVLAARPAFDFVAPDGIGHALWVVSGPDDVRWLREAFLRVPALYIADGHHRSAAAFRARNNLRAQNPGHTGLEPYNHFLSVAFPDDELRIMGYHRLVRDLGGRTPEAFLSQVGERFEVQPAERFAPDRPRCFACLVGGHWFRLTARPESFDERDPVEALDVSILQRNLLGPVLGIQDPRSDRRIDFVGGIRGLGELERRCQADMQVAFALHPVSVTELMAIADAGAILPPKSTWFEPKLRDAVVVRSLTG